MSAADTPTVETGDTAPNFWLPDATGELRSFYRRFLGNPVVLFFYPVGASAQRELRGFLDRGAAFAAAGAHVVTVVAGGVEAIAAPAAGDADGFTHLADPKGAITAGFCGRAAAGGGTASAVATFVIGRDQRVTGVRRRGPGHASWALARVEAEESPEAGSPVVAAHAPVLVVGDVFEPELCEELIAAWKKDHFEGTIARGTLAGGQPEDQAVDESLKRRRDCLLEADRDLALRRLTARRLGPVVFKAFQFETAFVRHFYIGAYSDDREDYFRPHRDNMTKSTRHRRFAISVNLNDDYEGGFLRFPEWGGALYRPPAGGALVFSCSLLHEALPVTRGTRFVALTFLSGPADVEEHQRANRPAQRSAAPA